MRSQLSRLYIACRAWSMSTVPARREAWRIFIQGRHAGLRHRRRRWFLNMIVIRLNTPEQNGTSGSDNKRQRRYLPAHALPASAPAPQTNVEIKKMLEGIHEKRLSTLDKGVRGSDTHAVPGSSILLRVGRSRLCVVSFVDSSPFADRRRIRAHPP